MNFHDQQPTTAMEPSGESDLNTLLKSLNPHHHPGAFVFCAVRDLSRVDMKNIVMYFKEEEAITIILKKEMADNLQLSYSSVMSWITLTVHSSLTAVGLTAAFAKALAGAGISCNVVSAFYHDHIFVEQRNTELALSVLTRLSAQPA